MSAFSGLALTVFPEWAWAIHALSDPHAKRVENRGGPPWNRLVGDDAPWVALHAGRDIGGRPGLAGIRDGLHSVQHAAKLAGHHAVVLAEAKDFWQIVVIAGGRRVQASDPTTGRLTVQGARTEGGVRVRPSPEDNERPIIASAIVGAIRIRRVLLPHEEDSLTPEALVGVSGWKIPEAYGWVFDYRPLPAPILGVKGAQGFWDVTTQLGRSGHDIDAVREAMGALDALAAGG